jgi:hypothetical protein
MLVCAFNKSGAEGLLSKKGKVCDGRHSGSFPRPISDGHGSSKPMDHASAYPCGLDVLSSLPFLHVVVAGDPSGQVRDELFSIIELRRLGFSQIELERWP